MRGAGERQRQVRQIGKLIAVLATQLDAVALRLQQQAVAVRRKRAPQARWQPGNQAGHPPIEQATQVAPAARQLGQALRAGTHGCPACHCRVV